MKREVTVYEVDSDRGTYWESDPFVPEIWESGVVEEDPWPSIKAMVDKGYVVTINSHTAYLDWLRERHGDYSYVTEDGVVEYLGEVQGE